MRLQGESHQLEVFPVCRKGEVRVGHGGYQCDLCTAAGLIRGEVFFQRLIFQAADAAEEINFPGNDAEIDTVLFSDHRLPGGRKISRNKLFTHHSDRIDRRQ